METLRAMLINQYNDGNMALNSWKGYYRTALALVNKKKASLFLIYYDTKSIQTSLNYHNVQILFLSIPSYDIDYLRPGLRNIPLLKILEWCTTNRYRVLDMGFGTFDHKD